MKGNESALYSQYIIDGIRQDTTPAELLDECMEYPEYDFLQEDPEYYDDIIDESSDPPVSTFRHDGSRNMKLAAEIASSEDRPFTMLYPEQFTRLKIASALISRLWSEGHFRLGDLRLWAQWEWNTRPIGNMAAFYASTSAASGYIYGLGVKMTDYQFFESDDASNVRFFAWLPEYEDTEDMDERDDSGLFKTSPYESRHPWIGEGRKCAGTLKDDSSSWVIYIPFDTCSYRLGGSLLAQHLKFNGGTGANIQDPDYFIDCYEVVRELTEDGIVAAGVCIGDGGLAAAAERIRGNLGLEMDLSGISSSYRETDMSRILFGETPGVLIQINDNDYDYLDSQLLLQDVAYYPLGHPGSKGEGLTFKDNGRNNVSGIIASLMRQASEGED